MRIEENVPLASLTSFRIGGPARFLIRPQSVGDVHKALDFARARNLPLLILGGGSNVLIVDEGFPGVVLKIELRGVEWRGSVVTAAAGEEWDALVEESVARGLWGLENLSGIPGSVGAAPVQNIGAYGAELKDTLESVEALDRARGEVVTLKSAACGFGYRRSLFKREPGRYIVLSITLGLRTEGRPNLAYKDIAAIFGGASAPALRRIREAVLAVRALKFPDLRTEGTAGSFFLNPVVSDEKAVQLRRHFPGLPAFPADGGVKISLAFILDRLGMKGSARGGARLFEKQPLVFAAARGCSARDVLSLAKLVEESVREACGIELEREVRVIARAL